METINIDSIKTDNKYLRFDTDVSKLQASIETVGIIAPLIINQDNLLIAGGRRYQALKNLDFTEAPIIRIDKNKLEEELISIDENLVRLDLKKIELEANLRRAKELYQEMAKEDETLSTKLLSEERIITDKIKEEKKLDEEINNNDDGVEDAVSKLASQKFLLDVSEKTGMSPRQVWQAIERDEKSSTSVRDARAGGELNLGQTNELIKLKDSEQEKILPYVKDKTVKEIRKIVAEVRSKGIEEGIELGSQTKPHAREIGQLLINIKKLQKISSKLELEGVVLTGKNQEDISKHFELLSTSMNKIMDTNTEDQNYDSSFVPHATEDMDSEYSSMS